MTRVCVDHEYSTWREQACFVWVTEIQRATKMPQEVSSLADCQELAKEQGNMRLPDYHPIQQRHKPMTGLKSRYYQCHDVDVSIVNIPSSEMVGKTKLSHLLVCRHAWVSSYYSTSSSLRSRERPLRRCMNAKSWLERYL